MKFVVQIYDLFIRHVKTRLKFFNFVAIELFSEHVFLR